MSHSSRAWVFTLRNLSENIDPDYEGKLQFENDERVTYALYQVEGTTIEESEYMKGYVKFQTSMRLSAVRKIIPNAHWEPRRISHDDMVLYINTSVENRIRGPYEYFKKKHRKKKVIGMTAKKVKSILVDVLKEYGLAD